MNHQVVKFWKSTKNKFKSKGRKYHLCSLKKTVKGLKQVAVTIVLIKW